MSETSSSELAAGDREVSTDGDSGDSNDQYSADTVRVVVTCVLAWAVPGLGHVSVGRVGRGVHPLGLPAGLA